MNAEVRIRLFSTRKHKRKYVKDLTSEIEKKGTVSEEETAGKKIDR